MTFAVWSPAFFSANQLTNPAISGMNSDADGDGVANLLEYAFDMNPVLPDRGARLTRRRPACFQRIRRFRSSHPTNQIFPGHPYVRWKASGGLGLFGSKLARSGSLDRPNASPDSFVVANQLDVGDGSSLEVLTVRPTMPMSGPYAPTTQFLRVTVTPAP